MNDNQQRYQQFNQEHAIETYKSLIVISLEYFKTLLYLNGGAVLLVLTYLGQLQSPTAQMLDIVKCPLYYFIGGLITGTFAFLFAYKTQLTLHNENMNDLKLKKGTHTRWLNVTVFITLISVACFSAGAYKGVNAIPKIAAMTLKVITPT